MLLLVKVGLALCALVLAVTSIGFETLDRRRPGRWFKQLRAPGFVAVAAAIGVFGFGVANEVMTARANEASEQRLNDEMRELRSEASATTASLAATQSRLADASEQLAFSITIGRELQASLDQAQIAVGGVRSRVLSHDIAVHELPRAEVIEASTYAELPVAIRAGDEVEWSLACHGATPVPSEFVGSVSFCGDNYGRLMAQNANPMLVAGTSGSMSVPANVQYGATLMYEPPYGRTCGPLHEAMRASMCVLQVRVYRESRHIIEEAIRAEGAPELPREPLPDHLCTVYTTLYGDRDCDRPTW